MKDARSLHSLMSATGIQHLVVLGRRLAGAKRVTIINYHSIQTHQTAFATGLNQFTSQIEYLKSRYKIIRLSDVRRILTTQDDHERYVVITFDDAFSDFHDLAYPVLEKTFCAVHDVCPNRYAEWSK